MYGDFVKHTSLFLYHYNDLWASGFLAKTTNSSFLAILVYVIYAYLHFILLILVIAFSKRFIKENNTYSAKLAKSWINIINKSK